MSRRAPSTRRRSAQLHRYAPGSVGRILPTKALLLRQIANALPPPYKFRPAGDLATEVERAKARRVPPDAYLASLDGHEPPIPANLMHTVYREYERRKSERGEIDFEDVLELAVRLLETDEQARADLRERYRAFTVDEYQDVNLLQQTLLDLWLGPRDDLCVVGDDYQSIYAFTGASPRVAARRAPGGSRARRSCGSRRTTARRRRCSSSRTGSCRASAAPRRCCGRLAPDGPEPELRSFVSAEAEDAWLAAELRALAREPACRSRRRRSSAAPTRGWPTSRRCCTRRACRSRARRCSGAMRRDGCSGSSSGEGSTGVARRVRELALDAGWLEALPDKLGERELTRQADLGRLVRLAAELDDGVVTCAEFAAELRRRFDPGGAGARGVHLLTYHRAKGLEFEAVFLPRLEDKELPSTPRADGGGAGRGAAAALRRHHAGEAAARGDLVAAAEPVPGGARRCGRARPAPAARGERAPTRTSRRRPRRSGAGASNARGRTSVPPYVIFPDRTIDELLARRPSSVAELAAIHGLGPARLARFGRRALRGAVPGACRRGRRTAGGAGRRLSSV